ncbi:GIY-YIG nuclease family protein [Algoriphagus sp. CAU 1675]|uniref:GIY-YIG nuclease family protein n=1 Tax=Algoriphagus sp. CAU 1675 TaxID=3032597 RepID=UPI0023DB3B8B|nr:GIY-YIG nuclease family protein [Algoriphagus sp. CAU 1675]MDF2159305.1 GIY-YIG nuclease family protein [Algoriphagus sp. CAU 1675]
MDFYVYILKSERDGSLYVGSSQNPEDRLLKHNRAHKGYTARKRPWKIVHVEKYETKSEALTRERFIKRQKSAVFIKELISGPAG